MKMKKCLEIFDCMSEGQQSGIIISFFSSLSRKVIKDINFLVLVEHLMDFACI
jgi:hypothetical protein